MHDAGSFLMAVNNDENFAVASYTKFARRVYSVFAVVFARFPLLMTF